MYINGISKYFSGTPKYVNGTSKYYNTTRKILIYSNVISMYTDAIPTCINVFQSISINTKDITMYFVEYHWYFDNLVVPPPPLSPREGTYRYFFNPHVCKRVLTSINNCARM
jgi:hypothetical protein